LAYEHYLRGKAYDERTRLKEAIEEYELATMEDPYFADAWAALASATADANFLGIAPVTIQQAESALNHARQLAPNSAGTLLAEAMVLANANAYEEAIEKLHAIIAIQPGSINAMILLSGVYVVQLRLEEARYAAERAVMLDPLNIEANWALAFVLGWSWSFDEARNYYDRVLAFEPENPHSWRFWMRYQIYLWGLGNTVAARQILEEAPATVSTLNHEIEFAYLVRDWPKLWELLAHTEETGLIRNTIEAKFHRLTGDAAAQNASGDLMRRAAEEQLEILIGRGAPRADVESARSEVAVALALAGNESEAQRIIDIAVARAAMDEDRLNSVPVYVNQILTDIFLGRNETAIERLRALFVWARPPYLTLHRLQLDPDYDDLRDHPDFKLLLEELSNI
jgi:Flp pilus assembly protein TadD